MTTPSLTLGHFSVSLAVKDLAASQTFYQKLGFNPAGGDGKQYVILQNGTSTLGLFQGMFPRNMLTFNPGWDAQCRPLETFTDVRQLLEHARAQGLEPVGVTVPGPTGPASFVVVDPDGNPVLMDQHV